MDEKTNDLPLTTRYPYILEELSRLASKDAQELLDHPSTKELRQVLSGVIESYVSNKEFTWQWHDQFQPEVRSHDGYEEKDKEEMDKLLNSIMGLDVVQALVADPTKGAQVKKIIETAVKVSFLLFYLMSDMSANSYPHSIIFQCRRLGM